MRFYEYLTPYGLNEKDDAPDYKCWSHLHILLTLLSVGPFCFTAPMPNLRSCHQGLTQRGTMYGKPILVPRDPKEALC